MRSPVIILSCLLFFATANSQELSVDELLTLNSLPASKFDQYISKKGYSKAVTGFDHDSITRSWEPKPTKGKRKKEEIKRQVERSQTPRLNMLQFRTSCPKEFNTLRGRLKKEGFACPSDTTLNCNFPLEFQKKHYTVKVNRIIEEEDTLYSFYFREKLPPAPVKIEFANDLLQFESHEDLVFIFGENNVKKDKYYFTEDVVRTCSVLFPYSPRQVAFLWKDDSTSSELASVIFGGSLGISSDLNYTSQIGENTWMLSNGVSCKLNLRELIKMNGGDFKFYGKRSDMFLSILPESNGDLELNEGISIVLGCMNCENAPILDKEYVSATEALKYGLGMHVMMVILSPPGKVIQATR